MPTSESTIRFIDLKRQYASIRSELDQAILRVIGSGSYVLGPEVDSFEREFASFCGSDHAVCVNSGTSALHLALIAAGIQPDDEVIAPAMTFVATVAAIQYVGARPVLVDVQPSTWTMDPNHVEAAVSNRTKAIIPVHLYGLAADMAAINEIARRRGITVIEDAAQAHGASLNGVMTGSLGEMACFSFYPTKSLGAAGEGGAVVSRDAKAIARIRELRDWGQREKYLHQVKGFNVRMEAMQGAVLRVKLRHLKTWIAQRQERARRYTALLAGTGLGLPVIPDGNSGHGFYVYAATLPGRDELRKHLGEAGIETGVHYPFPVHFAPAYQELGAPGRFPVSERLAAEELSLPLYPEITDHEIQRVVDSVKAWRA